MFARTPMLLIAMIKPWDIPRQFIQEIDMNKVLTSIAAATALAGLVLAQPAHAGLLEQVDNKVDNIKADTNTLKRETGGVRTIVDRVNTRTSNIADKANELIQRAEDTAASVHAVIIETGIIKQAVEPINRINGVFDSVQSLHDRFAELQFSPTDVLQNADLQYAVEQFQQRVDEAQQGPNSAEIEAFRGEFLSLLSDLQSVINVSDSTFGPSPLQTVIENAPASIIALVKKATEITFSPLAVNTAGLINDTNDMQALGWQEEFETDQAMCSFYSLNSERVYRKALRATKRVMHIVALLKIVNENMPEKDVDLGIHGYAHLTITIGDKAKAALKILEIEYERRKDKLDLVRELAEHYAGFVADSRPCED